MSIGRCLEVRAIPFFPIHASKWLIEGMGNGVGVVAVGWNGYLSYLNQKTAQDATTPAPATLSMPIKLPLPSVEPAAAAVAAAA